MVYQTFLSINMEMSNRAKTGFHSKSPTQKCDSDTMKTILGKYTTNPGNVNATTAGFGGGGESVVEESGDFCSGVAGSGGEEGFKGGVEEPVGFC